MADIAYVSGESGKAAAASATVSWSAGNTAVLLARNIAATIPLLPSGWNNIVADATGGGGSNYAMRLG